MNKTRHSRRAILSGLGSLLSTTAGSEERNAGAAVTGEATIILFDTAAHVDAQAGRWSVPLHAWVFEPQASRVRKAAIEALLRRTYGLVVDAANRTAFDARINLLLADNKRGRSPQVSIDGLTKALPASAPNGHSRTVVLLDRPVLQAQLPVTSMGAAPAMVQLIPPEGVSVISDIDDTVKDTGVLERKRLFASTFLKPFTPVAGMSDLITRLAGPNGAVHYVSSSPWHLYPPLRQWLTEAGFPVSALHLKHIRLKDRTILDITRSPVETKPPIITGILARWPRRRFVLVGDSGEKDPEVYARIARVHPSQVARILIRRVPGDPTPSARLDTVFAGLPRTLWQVFTDPSDVRL